MTWFKRGADHGDADSMYGLGNSTPTAGVWRRTRGGKKWYCAAARHGQPWALKMFKDRKLDDECPSVSSQPTPSQPSPSQPPLGRPCRTSRRQVSRRRTVDERLARPRVPETLHPRDLRGWIAAKTDGDAQMRSLSLVEESFSR